MVLVVNLPRYSLKDKNFLPSFAKDFGRNNKIEKSKTKIIKWFLLFFSITKTIRAFIKFHFSKCEF